jgi:transcriptional regulator with XRE-family HTH domain
MKIHLVDDDTYFFGTPADIVRRMRGRAHTRGRDLDAYMRKVAGEYGFELDGESVDERCEAFLVGLIAKGPARPVFAAGVDMHAVRVLRQVLGLSREKLAQSLGVSQMTVNRWEAGGHAIADDRLEDIKRVLFDRVSSPGGTPEPVAVDADPVQTHDVNNVLTLSRQRVRQRMLSVQASPTRTRSAQRWRA